MLAAPCLAWLPAGLPAGRHPRCLPVAPHEKRNTKPPTKTLLPANIPKRHAAAWRPCPFFCRSSHAPSSPSRLPRRREEEEEEELLLGQPGVLMPRGAVPSPLQRGGCTLGSRKLQELSKDPIKSRKVQSPAKLKCETVLYGALIQCLKKIYIALFCPEHS